MPGSVFMNAWNEGDACIVRHEMPMRLGRLAGRIVDRRDHRRYPEFRV